MSGPEAPRGSDHPDLRVILVGPAPVESRLRRDPGIELIRARTPIDAIGELADPIDDDSPARTAVIVGRGMIPHDEAADLVNALRAVDADVAVLAIPAGPDTRANGRSPFDAELPADSGAESLRALLDSLDSARTAQPAPTAAVPLRPLISADPSPPAHVQKVVRPPAPDSFDTIEPAHVPPPSALDDSSAPDDETAVLAALLSGSDPTEPLLAAMRRRLAVSVDFLAQTDPPESPSPVEHRVCVCVQRRGTIFGWLLADSAAEPRLAIEVDRLAHWLSLAEQQRQLREAAFTDSLTGALNRRHFLRHLPRAIEVAREKRHELTLLLFDIDDFKTYNDRFGHAAGDDILRETVRLLKSVIRPSDRVYRLGGDEFVVVFDDPGGPRSSAGRRPVHIGEIAARFQRQIREHRFPKLGAKAPARLTISGGLATYPWDGATAEALLERADQLALESKRNGKNAITFGPDAERVCGPTGGPDTPPTPGPAPQP